MLAVLGRFDRFAPVLSPFLGCSYYFCREGANLVPGGRLLCIAPSMVLCVSKTRASISLLCLGAPLSSPLVPFFLLFFLGQLYGPANITTLRLATRPPQATIILTSFVSNGHSRGSNGYGPPFRATLLLCLSPNRLP